MSETTPEAAPTPVAGDAHAAVDAAAVDDAAAAAEDLPPAPPLPYGARLRAARERMGLHQSHVASTLHLEERVVRALEEGCADELPALVYVRGYVRAYANLVGLAGADLMADFDQNGDPPAEHVPTRPHAPREKMPLADLPRRRAGLLFSGIVAVVVVALAGTLWAIQSAFDWSFVGNAEVPPVPPPVWRAEQEPERAAGDDIARDGDSSAGPAAPGAEQDAPVGTLEFVIRADSWVEVSDAGQRTLLKALGKAGETLTVSGAPPLTIDIGYAAGVDLRYNGEVVALGPHTQGSVAQLVLE